MVTRTYYIFPFKRKKVVEKLKEKSIMHLQQNWQNLEVSADDPLVEPPFKFKMINDEIKS